MKFLEYANETHSNIIPKEDFEELVHEVFGVIASNLSKSLGPLGSSATILDGMQTEATKDGYAILNKYRFHNRYKKMIYNLIKAPCTKMNNTVGDGTTTAIALTDALFAMYRDRKNVLDTLYRLPRQFNRVWDDVVAELIEKIQEHAVTIDPTDYDTIYNIAYVTSNGNHEVSDAIAKVYAEVGSPAIKQKDSPTNKSYISPINGFDFPANLISDVYVRNQDMTATEQNINVMVFDFTIETDFFTNVIVPINEVLKAQGKKLLILAPSYDKLMCDTILEQYVRREFREKTGINLILAQFRMSTLEQYHLPDLCTVLRTKTITQSIAGLMTNEFKESSPDAVIEKIFTDATYELSNVIGIAAEALLSCEAGSIFKVDDIKSDERYQEALSRAKKTLEDITAQTSKERQSYAAKIYNAKARVAQLEMKNFIWYIGADSQLQKNIIWDSVEDVIKCVRSAVKSGIVPGCQLSIIQAANEIMTEILGDSSTKDTESSEGSTAIVALPNDQKLRLEIVSIIVAACGNVYGKVLHGPDGMGIIKLLNRWQFTTEDGVAALQKEAMSKAESIVRESIEKNQVFDLETLEFNPKIITSAETDQMVLSAASELVKILISGNQCIVLDADVDSSEEKTVEAYV